MEKFFNYNILRTLNNNYENYDNVGQNNDISGNNIQNNDISGNIIQNNDVNANDVSGNIIPNLEKYKDENGNLYNYCNTTINSEEYYTSLNTASSIVGGTLSMPFIISSLSSSIIITIFLGFLARSYYKSAQKKFTFAVVFTIICALCFLSSTIQAMINLYNAKNKLSLKNNPESRPCYSRTQQKLLK
jgi:hypothetical protein